MRAAVVFCLLVSAFVQVYSANFTVYTQGNWNNNIPKYTQSEPSGTDGLSISTAFVYTSSAVSYLKQNMRVGDTAQVLFTLSFVQTHQSNNFDYSDGFSVVGLNNTVFRPVNATTTIVFSQDSSYGNDNIPVPLITFRNCTNITLFGMVCDENYGLGCINVNGGTNYNLYGTTWMNVGLAYRITGASNVNVYGNTFRNVLAPVMIVSSQNVNVYNNKFYDGSYRPVMLPSQQTAGPFGPPMLVGIYVATSKNVNLTTNYFFNVTMGVYVNSGSVGLYGNSFFGTGSQALPVRNYDAQLPQTSIKTSWALSCPNTSAITWLAFDGNGFCGIVANSTFSLSCGIPATPYTSFFDPCHTCAPKSVWACDGSCFNSLASCPTPKDLYVSNTAGSAPDGSTFYPNIRAAMNQAQWRDRIILQPGTYSGPQNQGPGINLIGLGGKPFVGSIVAAGPDPFFNNVTIDCTKQAINHTFPTSYLFINALVSVPADFLVRGIRFVGCGQILASRNQNFSGGHVDRVIYEQVGPNLYNWQGVLNAVVILWSQFSITNSLIRHVNTTEYRRLPESLYFAYPISTYYPGIIQTARTTFGNNFNTIYPNTYYIAKIENVVMQNVSVEAHIFMGTGGGFQDIVASNVSIVGGESRIGLISAKSAATVSYNFTNVVYFPNDKLACADEFVCDPSYDALVYCDNAVGASETYRQTWPWYNNVYLYEQTLPLGANCQGSYNLTDYILPGVNITDFFIPAYGVMPKITPAPPSTTVRSVCGLPTNFPTIYKNLNTVGQDCNGECFGGRFRDDVGGCCLLEQFENTNKYCFALPSPATTTVLNPATTTVSPTGPGTTAIVTGPGPTAGPGTTATTGGGGNNNDGGSGQQTSIGGVDTPVFYFLALALVLALF